MKVVILNCFETNENRVQVIYDFFSNKSNEVIIVQSDFKHILKSHRNDEKDNHIFVKSKPYYKNLSINRLISHYRFSKDSIRIIEKENPDLLYVIFPPNSLAKFASKYKRHNQNVKLIFDIMDLWPETMPIGKVKKFPPFTFWGELRDRSLKYADLVITECDLYQSVLGDVLKDLKVETLHLAKREINVVSNPQLSEDEIHLAYLGSINNIIDIPKIKELIKTIREVKPVTLHIVGDGESKNELINAAEISGAIVEYHGKIYDSQEKQDIFDGCHFGLNIMKNSVCVGLTMKSIDYFQHGLPIINNIPADTAEIVEKYEVGINVTDDIELTKTYFKNAFNLDSSYCMRDNALRLFKEKFSVQAFNSSFEEYVYKGAIKL